MATDINKEVAVVEILLFIKKTNSPKFHLG
jgi:hypothetical protein